MVWSCKGLKGIVPYIGRRAMATFNDLSPRVQDRIINKMTMVLKREGTQPEQYTWKMSKTPNGKWVVLQAERGGDYVSVQCLTGLSN